MKVLWGKGTEHRAENLLKKIGENFLLTVSYISNEFNKFQTGQHKNIHKQNMKTMLKVKDSKKTWKL